VASTIRIKRSTTQGDPSTLGTGELAYSSLAGAQNNGGDRLYIGMGTETGGNAANHFVIGGKYFTDLLDHVHGTLTANSAIIADADKKIDNLLVDNLELNGNTLGATTGDLVLSAATNLIQLANNNYIAGGTSDGSQLILATGDASLKQLRGGTVKLIVGADGNATSTLTFNNNGTLTIPGTIAATGTNTNITLTPTGTGKVSINNAYTLPNTDGTAGYVLTTDGAGTVSFQASSSSLSIKDDLNNTDSVNLLTDSFSILGGEGIGTLVTDNTVTISGEDASTSSKGIAKFTSTDFSVSSGEVSLVASRIQDIVGTALAEGEGIDISFNSGTHVTTISAELATDTNPGVASFSNDDFAVSVGGEVTIKAAGVGNSQLEHSKVTVGSTDINLGSTSTTLAGLTQVDVDFVKLTGNTIAITTSSYELVLDPSNGISTGTINVSNARITNLAEPLSANDAATKYYVDTVAEGLHIHEAAHCATTATLAVLSGGSVTYSTGTLGVGATLNLSIGLSVVDGHSLNNGDRILVKDEANQAHNGIYVRTNATTLTRASDFDTAAEINGGDFTFVENGTLYNKTGWVQTTEVLDVGVDNVVWQQFSGAGVFAAGIGLSLTGTTFDINTATNTGLYISGDTLQIDPTLAGDGLTYNTGVLAIGGTSDRISVTADAVDIAATYVGQSSITTLGTITSGTWNATAIATEYGGTGFGSYSVGDILYANSTTSLVKLSAGSSGTVLQIVGGVPVWGVLDGGTY
jgi:hypothetical protein